MSRVEEELRDKIKHYEHKERDLIERERLFELKMKEDFDKFTNEKTISESEIVRKETQLN